VKQIMVIEDEDGDMVSRLVSEGCRLETVQDFFTRSSALCGLHHPTYDDAKEWLAKHPDYVPKKTNLSAERKPLWKLPAPAKDITNDITAFNAAPEAERLKAIESAEAKYRAAERAGRDSVEARADWLRLQHWQASLSSAQTPTNSSHPGCSKGG
jgi:hypothetical protein